MRLYKIPAMHCQKSMQVSIPCRTFYVFAVNMPQALRKVTSRGYSPFRAKTELLASTEVHSETYAEARILV